MVTYAVADPAAGWGGREIYAAAFDGPLFYDLFLQSWGGHGPLGPLVPLDPLLIWNIYSSLSFILTIQIYYQQVV